MINRIMIGVVALFKAQKTVSFVLIDAKRPFLRPFFDKNPHVL
jgi:hypothetical protein